MTCSVGPAQAGDRDTCPPSGTCLLKRWHPVGGWDPYGGGLLRWWPSHCFPHSSPPDDYCRKPLPGVCWPPYPPYFIVVPPASCAAPSEGPPMATPGKSIQDSLHY